MKPWPEQIGSIGSIVAAAACPVCFPKLALIGAVFGLGAFGAYESQLFVAAQALVAVAVVGHAAAYRRHRNPWPLAAALASALAVFAGIYLLRTEWLAYIGFAGLVAASARDFWLRMRVQPKRAITDSVITCPKCGFREAHAMPPDACIVFYDCPGCGERLHPRSGDCCVFCSYGSVKCPPMQLAGR